MIHKTLMLFLIGYCLSSFGLPLSPFYHSVNTLTDTTLHMPLISESIDSPPTQDIIPEVDGHLQAEAYNIPIFPEIQYESITLPLPAPHRIYLLVDE